MKRATSSVLTPSTNDGVHSLWPPFQPSPRVVQASGIALVLLVLAGCRFVGVSDRHIATAAVHYNSAVERAQNETLFLNIVRCMRHHPQHFTDLTKITGADTREGKLTVGVAFGRGTSDAYTLTPEVTVSSGPTYEVGVLHTREFIRGIMQPVDPAQIKAFLDQGWPFEFLLMLFIRDLETGHYDEATGVFADDSEHHRFFNGANDDPSAPSNADIDAFSVELHDLLVNKRLTIQVKSEFITPPLSGDELADVIGSDAFVNGDVEIDPATSRVRAKAEAFFAWEGGAQSKANPSGELSLPPNKKQLSYVLRLRSPEAVLYYLGELMRAEQLEGKQWRPSWHYFERAKTAQPADLVLFYAREKRSGDEGELLSVEYGGSEYVVPASAKKAKDSPTDLSMMTLACHPAHRHEQEPRGSAHNGPRPGGGEKIVQSKNPEHAL